MSDSLTHESPSEVDDVGLGDPSGAVLYYDGGDSLPGLPTRAGLAAAHCAAESAELAALLAARDPVAFMPSDVADATDYAGGEAYCLRLYGALADGTKAEVRLSGIVPFFDVEVPAGAAAGATDWRAVAGPAALARAFDTRLRADLRAAPEQVEAIEGRPLRGWHPAPRPYRRVYHRTLRDRKVAIAAARDAGYATASDDSSAYYRKASRELGLPLGSWAALAGYAREAGPTPRSPRCAHVFRLPAAGYRPLEGPPPRDRTLVVAWDIETHSGRGLGDLPRPHHAEDEVFMICLTAHWAGDAAPLAAVCLTEAAAAPDARWTTVVCGTPANVVRAFALALGALAPEAVIGFNDSDYDWPFVVEKAHGRGELAWLADRASAAPPARGYAEEAVFRWDYRQKRPVKISAEATFYCSYLQLPGAVPVDMRVCFKKLFPKAESPKAGSLKYFLDACGLPSKADMPIARMWRTLEAARAAPTPATAEGMRQVAHYCVVDALRCQQLQVRRRVLADYRETAALAFVSLADAHYCADGMRVANLLGAYAARRGVLMSMATSAAESEGKYPGAYVFPPERGLERRRPVTGLDFASLYPSLIMAYNLSPDRIVTGEREARALEAAGETLHEIAVPYGGRVVRAWSVRHGGVAAAIGLYPAVLIDLFARRAAMKVELGRLGDAKELFEHLMADRAAGLAAAAAALAEASAALARLAAALAPGAPPPRVPPGSTPAAEAAELARQRRRTQGRAAELERLVGLGDGAALLAEYERVCFEWGCLDSKQKALKVQMNTFYGVAGRVGSPLFMLELAVAVTSAGQTNIKLVADYILRRGYSIKYGDTDSIYVVCPDSVYAECDAEHAAGRLAREEYWTAMVNLTMRAMDALREEVNAFLAADNGTKYLKMAYEEVLFPVVFTGKKKYFGVGHVTIPNFHPRALFVRGIDVVKAGQSGIAREVGHRVMWACVAVAEERSVLRIVEDVLGDAVTRPEQWPFEAFVQTDAWKPDKQNLAVQRYVARVRARHAAELAEAARRVAAGEPPAPFSYEPPDAGERFSYIVARLPAAFDLRGRKLAPSKGDRMEPAAAARAGGQEPDIAYYLVKYIVGLCARFISGEPQFQPPGAAEASAADEYSQRAAKKHLEALLKRLQSEDPAVLRRRGVAYRQAFARGAADARAALVRQVGAPAAQLLHGRQLDYSDYLPGPAGAGGPIAALWAAAGGLAETAFDGRWRGRAAGAPPQVSAALEASQRARPDGLWGVRAAQLSAREGAIRAEMGRRLPPVAEVAVRYEADLARLVQRQRAAVDGPAAAGPPAGEPTLLAVTAADSPPLLQLRTAVFQAAGVQAARQAPRRLADVLRQLRAAREQETAALLARAPAAPTSP